MKNILAIGGSNSKKSINTVFATHIAQRITNANVTTVKWDELVLPLYSPDLEAESGIPAEAEAFKKMILESDGIVLSLAEHNGLPTAAFKNLWDWTSRIEQKFWADKPMFLASTSPGGRGGVGALGAIKNIISHFGGNVIVDFSLPSFQQNLQDGKIADSELELSLAEKVNQFQQSK
tara:strand:- start:7321 stop:7851 length:531 start_codon:yes stop_codon:yes gene_type:complete